MSRKIKRIFVVMLIIVMTYNNVCFADMISPSALTAPISLMAGFVSVLFLFLYAFSYFCFMFNKQNKKEIVKNEEETVEKSKKIDLKEAAAINIYKWLMVLIASVAWTVLAFTNTSFFLTLIPTIFSWEAVKQRKEGNKKKAVLLTVLSIIVLVILMYFCSLSFSYDRATRMMVD